MTEEPPQYVCRKIAEGEEWEFWISGLEGQEDVFRVRQGSPVDERGVPLGMRWECSLEHWKRFRSVFDWAKDVA